MEKNARRWERLEELFAEAIELPRDSQAAFVERATASDEGLGRELRALLDHDAGAGRRIAQAIGGAAKAAATPLDWKGRRFGSYRIVGEIGRGGMGLVFQAVRDDDEYRKTVALKIAPWWCDLDLLRERFRHERQILAELEHPNIARFLDGGTEDGIPYFAMEYVEGCPITEYAARHGLKLREKIELFRQVCSAVHYAHQSLLVHRDLKPGNILVSDAGVAKLLDFGIAKLLTPFPDAERNTLTGTAPWTPDYASPEQVRARPITTRADIYSLGLILFELLTGERGQTADNSSPLALDRSICEVETPRPSTRVSRAVARQLAGDLDTIVGKATHKDPDRRYGSAAEFSDDLGRYLEGRPVLARKDSFRYRAAKFLRRNWLPVGAASVASLSLVAGAIGFAWQARVAESRFNQVRKLATVFLFDVHDKVRDLPGATGVRQMLTRTAVDSLDSLSRNPGHNYSLRRELAAAYLRLGRVQGNTTGASLGRNAEALASFDHGISLLNGMPASELAQAAETESGLREDRGGILEVFGRSDQAGADFERAVQIGNSLCHDALRETQACKNRLDALFALAELRLKGGLSNSRTGSEEEVLREFDKSLEALRPTLSSSNYQQLWLRAKMNWSRLQFVRAGERSALEILRPSWPVVEQMMAADPASLDALRLAVNYCMFYGAYGAEVLGSADPQLGGVLSRGVEWSTRLAELDRDDLISRRKLADAIGLRGAFVARDDPARAVPLLREALHLNLEQIRLSPANLDTRAVAVAKANSLAKALVRLGREQQAADELQPMLEFYDPLSTIGLKLERSQLVREIQAAAWVAQAGTVSGKSGGVWYRDAARRAESALQKSPSDPALQAAVAGLYDALPGNAEDRSLWNQRAAGLWEALAARFPENASLRKAVTAPH